MSRDQLRTYGNELGYDMANTDRQLRSLTEDGKVIPLKNKKNFIEHYEYKEQGNAVMNFRMPPKLHTRPKCNPWRD